MTRSAEEKVLASALARLSRLERASDFDTARPGSRPTTSQQEVISDFGTVRHQYVGGGNQCLRAGTLVATPRGPVAIEEIRPGDKVYSESGKEISVLQTFRNGKKVVSNLTCRGLVWASSTRDHVWLTESGKGKEEERSVSSFRRDDRVYRVPVRAPLGTIREPHAYAIGALLGDGCSREKRRTLRISSATSEIPDRVSRILGGPGAVRCHLGNYTWNLQVEDANYYSEWCRGRYAHEKRVDLDVIRSWDRQSLLEFVAGVMDTDGSVHPAKDHISLSIGMQAKSVIDAMEYAFLALWCTPLSTGIDRRPKYKNGPVYEVYTRNSNLVRDILVELSPLLSSPQKKWRAEYEALGGRRSSSSRVKLQWEGTEELADTYDIHVDSPRNLYLLANGLVTHNSGKSQLGARLVSWMLEETHPSWRRPAEWGDEPLLILVLGRTTKQVEDTLWRKLTTFINPADYRLQTVGGILQRATHRVTGNTLLFFSHHSVEEAREKVQSFVAHAVWLDELPGSIRLIEELHRRVQARKGYFLSTFTPKAINQEIRRLVEHSEPPYSKKYLLRALDNPIYDEESRTSLLRSLETLPENYRRTILDGAWMTPEESVYFFDYDTHVAKPPDYSPSWRHVESVDPAIKSKLGYCLLAEDPKTGIWYLVRAEYVSGIFSPSALVQAVVEKSRGVNVIRRVCDPHEAWYLGAASAAGISPTYMCPHDKNSRKMELIKNLQEALGTSLLLAPWCDDAVAEFQECHWSDSAEGKISGASRFHLLDSLQYFVDVKPKREVGYAQMGWDSWLYQQNEARKAAEAKAERKQGTKNPLRPRNILSVRRKSIWTR